MKLGFIGAGKVGTALAVKLKSKGYAVVAVYDAKPDSVRNFASLVSQSRVVSRPQDVVNTADFIFISVPDAFIEPVAAALTWRPGQMAVHCSGANTVALLESARKQGALVGVFHPNQTFADARQAVEKGITFDIEANEPLLSTLKEMATTIDAYWIVLKAEDKAVFHVAVECTSLFALLLFRVSAKLMQTMGITSEQAARVSVPMIKATAGIVEAFGTSRPLTGPVDRRDTETIRKHIAGLKRLAPTVLPLYLELVRQNIPFALEHGSIDQQKAAEILTIVNNSDNPK